LNFGYSNLFRLPARSRFGEGRDFEFRASDLVAAGPPCSSVVINLSWT
jgi:hypothetical protein